MGQDGVAAAEVDIRRRERHRRLVVAAVVVVLDEGGDRSLQLPDDSVDLIYLDPPFNSKRSYNVLFNEVSGAASAAQIKAFEDTWTYNLTTWRTDAHTFESAKAEQMLPRPAASYVGELGIRGSPPKRGPAISRDPYALSPGWLI